MKQQLIQPKGQFSYVVDMDGNVFLVNSEAKTVKTAIGVTKRRLSMNKIAYFWTNSNIVQHFKNKGFDVLDLEVSLDTIEFKFQEHKFSEQQVVCSMCGKFTISEDNVKEQIRHGKSHYFDSYGMNEASLTKFFVRVS